MIYLASRYSDPDPNVREARYQAVLTTTRALIQAGHHVFSPIVHGHHLSKLGLPYDADFWKGYNIEMLSGCEGLLVLDTPQWYNSAGIQEELQIAKILKLTVSMQKVLE